MILLLVIAAWTLVFSMVMGMCAAARAGDRAQLAPRPAGWGRAEAAAWGPFEHLEIAARANPHAVGAAESSAPVLQRDDVAA